MSGCLVASSVGAADTMLPRPQTTKSPPNRITGTTGFSDQSDRLLVVSLLGLISLDGLVDLLGGLGDLSLGLSLCLDLRL